MKLHLNLNMNEEEFEKYLPELEKLASRFENLKDDTNVVETIKNDIKVVSAAYSESPSRLLEVKHNFLNELLKVLETEFDKLD